MHLWLLWGFRFPPSFLFYFYLICLSFSSPSFTCHVPPPLTFPSLLSFSGGISSDLQDKRKKCQNKRKNQITDSSQLKDFPCKKFRQVSSPSHTQEVTQRDPVSCEHTRRKYIQPLFKNSSLNPHCCQVNLKQTAHSCTCQSNLCLLYFPDKVSVGKTLCWFTAAPVKHYTHFFLFFLEITTEYLFFFLLLRKDRPDSLVLFSRTAEMIWNEMFHTSSDPLEDNGPDRRAHLNTIANGNKVH